MADAKVLEFIRKAEQDPELGAEVRAVNVTDKDQALAALVQIAQRAGYQLGRGALEEGLAACAPRELSDDDLDAASGGTQYNQTDWQFVDQRASAFGAFFTLAKS